MKDGRWSLTEDGESCGYESNGDGSNAGLWVEANDELHKQDAHGPRTAIHEEIGHTGSCEDVSMCNRGNRQYRSETGGR